MNEHRRIMETYALMGFVGGIIFVIGDCLLYCYKGYSDLGIDPLWIEVDEWRFVLSAWLGFAGMVLMLPAFYSYYKMIEETCGKVLRMLASFMAVGVAATGFLHFAVGPLLPITYKSIITTGGTAEIAYAVAEHLQGILAPLEMVLIAFLFLEYITHFVAVVSGKTGLPRIICLVGPVGTVILGIIWKVAFKDTVVAGAWGACESMGEALVFLTAAIYWRKTLRTCYERKKKFSLKYRILLKLCKVFRLQRVMELPPDKAQKLFRKSYKGVVIPQMSDPGISISTTKINGSTCLWYKHVKPNRRLCIYLIGGGMLKYPKPSQAKEVLGLSRELGIDFVLPYYPLVHTGHTLPDVYEMMYALYKDALTQYEPENVFLLGGSSGANLALGLISYFNDKGEGVPMPGKVYAGSPGSLLITDEEKKKADKLDKTDVIMSQKATLSVWEGMTGGKKVADYMESLQLGDYTGLKDVYLSFGGDEVFTAAADSIRERLEQFGVHVTLEIEPGLYHAYAVMPLVKDAMPGYRRMKEYIKR